MKRARRSASPPPPTREAPPSPRWCALLSDVLAVIFTYVHWRPLLLVVSVACKHWRRCALRAIVQVDDHNRWVFHERVLEAPYALTRLSLWSPAARRYSYPALAASSLPSRLTELALYPCDGLAIQGDVRLPHLTSLTYVNRSSAPCNGSRHAYPRIVQTHRSQLCLLSLQTSDPDDPFIVEALGRRCLPALTHFRFVLCHCEPSRVAHALESCVGWDARPRGELHIGGWPRFGRLDVFAQHLSCPQPMPRLERLTLAMDVAAPQALFRVPARCVLSVELMHAHVSPPSDALCPHVTTLAAPLPSPQQLLACTRLRSLRIDAGFDFEAYRSLPGSVQELRLCLLERSQLTHLRQCRGLAVLVIDNICVPRGLAHLEQRNARISLLREVLTSFPRLWRLEVGQLFPFGSAYAEEFTDLLLLAQQRGVLEFLLTLETCGPEENQLMRSRLWAFPFHWGEVQLHFRPPRAGELE